MPSKQAPKTPKGWAQKHGAWYYRVPVKKREHWDGKAWFRLGGTLSEAYQTWYAKLGSDADDSDFALMTDVFNSYEREVLPKRAESTRRGYRGYLRPLRRAFDRMRPTDVKPIHAYRYLERRTVEQNAPIAANREISVLIKVMTHAVRKGAVERNLLKGQIERNPERPRERVPDDEEISGFLACGDAFMRGYVALKKITGMRQHRMLGIDLTKHWRQRVVRVDGQKVEEWGLIVEKAKGGRDVFYHGAGVTAAIEMILYQRGDSPLWRGPLFLTRGGTQMSAEGFRSRWTRQTNRYVAKGGTAFHEHDLRAYTADEALAEGRADRAMMLLGHTDSRMVERVYGARRGWNVEVVG